MKTQFCAVLDADGLHEDDWCAPKLRLRLRAARPALKLVLSVWVPDRGGADKPIAFRVAVGRPSLFQRLFGRARRFQVRPGHPTPLIVPTDLEAGDEIALSVATRHRLKKSNSDIRDLSFMLQGVALGGRT